MKTWKQKHREISLELYQVQREKHHLNEDLENYIHELHKEIVELRTDEKLSKLKTNPDQMVKITSKRQIMKVRYLIIAVICAGIGMQVGIRYEATRIQTTCENDQGATWLNGTAYLCLSQRQIELINGNQKGPRA